MEINKILGFNTTSGAVVIIDTVVIDFAGIDIVSSEEYDPR